MLPARGRGRLPGPAGARPRAARRLGPEREEASAQGQVHDVSPALCTVAVAEEQFTEEVRSHLREQPRCSIVFSLSKGF